MHMLTSRGQATDATPAQLRTKRPLGLWRWRHFTNLPALLSGETFDLVKNTLHHFCDPALSAMLMLEHKDFRSISFFLIHRFDEVYNALSALTRWSWRPAPPASLRHVNGLRPRRLTAWWQEERLTRNLTSANSTSSHTLSFRKTKRSKPNRRSFTST